MISNKPVAAENKRAEDSFKAKSDESEQLVAAAAATPDIVVAVRVIMFIELKRRVFQLFRCSPMF
jgi:hypothetical protein